MASLGLHPSQDTLKDLEELLVLKEPVLTSTHEEDTRLVGDSARVAVTFGDEPMPPLRDWRLWTNTGGITVGQLEAMAIHQALRNRGGLLVGESTTVSVFTTGAHCKPGHAHQATFNLARDS